MSVMKIPINTTEEAIRTPIGQDGRGPADRDETLVRDLRLARESVGAALAESGSWTILGRKRIHDPDLRKYFNRLNDAFGELLRLAERDRSRSRSITGVSPSLPRSSPTFVPGPTTTRRAVSITRPSYCSPISAIPTSFSVWSRASAAGTSPPPVG